MLLVQIGFLVFTFAFLAIAPCLLRFSAGPAVAKFASRRGFTGGEGGTGTDEEPLCSTGRLDIVLGACAAGHRKSRLSSMMGQSALSGVVSLADIARNDQVFAAETMAQVPSREILTA